MDFRFTEEQLLYKATVEKLVKEKIEPLLARHPSEAPLPKEAVLQILGWVQPLGFIGARIPQDAGGSGLDLISLGIANELIPYDAIVAPRTNATLTARIYYGGSPELRLKYLPPVLKGEFVGASAASEPNVGSDPTGIETRAVLDKGDYVLNGTKVWATNADICDLLHVVAATGKDERGRNVLTRFIVERKKSPFEARPMRMLGHDQGHLCEVVLDNCRVPRDNVVGLPGDGHRVLTITWMTQRPLIGLLAVGLAQRALDASIIYAKQRKQFGKPIASFQLIQDMIVEMSALVEASRLLSYKALSLLQAGEKCPKESSMAKYWATEAAVKVTSMAIQIHGAYGLSKEYPLEKYFRDARMLTIPDGTTQIQKLIVGREILGIRAFA